MSPKRPDVEGLVAVGRRLGALTSEDLAKHLPISRMSVDEVSVLVVRLEQAGIPVEMDGAFLITRDQIEDPRPRGIPKLPAGETQAAAAAAPPPDLRASLVPVAPLVLAIAALAILLLAIVLLQI